MERKAIPMADGMSAGEYQRQMAQAKRWEGKAPFGPDCRCWCQVRPIVCTLSGCACVIHDPGMSCRPVAVPFVSFPKFGFDALQARPAGPIQVSEELLAAGRKNVGVLVALNSSVRNSR